MRAVLATVLVAALGLAACGGGGSTSINTACLASSRSPGAAVCRCVASLAPQYLSRGDQRKAANIIVDPDLILRYTQSDSGPRRAFLQRYRAWANASAKACRAQRSG